MSVASKHRALEVVDYTPPCPRRRSANDAASEATKARFNLPKLGGPVERPVLFWFWGWDQFARIEDAVGLAVSAANLPGSQAAEITAPACPVCMITA